MKRWWVEVVEERTRLVKVEAPDALTAGDLAAAGEGRLWSESGLRTTPRRVCALEPGFTAAESPVRGVLVLRTRLGWVFGPGIRELIRGALTEAGIPVRGIAAPVTFPHHISVQVPEPSTQEGLRVLRGLRPPMTPTDDSLVQHRETTPGGCDD